MNYLISIFFVAMFIQAGGAQDELTCDIIFESNYDKIEKRTIFTSLSMPGKVLNNFGTIYTTLNFTTDMNGFMISFRYMGDLACMEKDGRIKILLEDDTTIEFNNAFDYNCEGLASIAFFKGSKTYKEVDKLKKIRISSLRIYFSTGSRDLDFTVDKGEFIRKGIECAIEDFSK